MHTIESVKFNGFKHGRSLAEFNYRYAKTYSRVFDSDQEPNEDDVEAFRDEVMQICWEADENYRQYSPFEFFAKDLNDAENSDELWEAYEESISEGIYSFIDKKLAKFEG